MPSKSRSTVNLVLAMEALKEVAANICECGHFDSEHFLSKALKPVHCAECKCSKFKQAFSHVSVDLNFKERSVTKKTRRSVRKA